MFKNRQLCDGHGAMGFLKDIRALAMFCAAALFLLAIWSIQAQAHVKWFASYIVGAAPKPLMMTLTNLWFWSGLGLVLLFFLLARALEKSTVGETILLLINKVSDPLWNRIDDFVRVVIGAFFVAIFAVGGVYLTPDLKTPSEWVSWAQLLIAAAIFLE